MKSGPTASVGGARCALVLACVMMATPALAQGGLGDDEMKAFGGRYATDCAQPAAPQLRVTRDALLVQQANQRMTGSHVQPQYSYYGNSAPPGFMAALVSEVRGGAQLTFLSYADKAGGYIRLDGDAKVMAALGKALASAKYRRCDLPAPTPAAAAGPPAAPRPEAAGGVPPLGALMADPQFKRTYLRTLGPRASEPWLARLDGPAPETRGQTLDGTRYVVIAACKAHDCYDHSALFLYSAEQARVLGLIQDNGRKALVGAPTPAQSGQLDRLWQAEFRRN